MKVVKTPDGLEATREGGVVYVYRRPHDLSVVALKEQMVDLDELIKLLEADVS
jgi:hypothetical protein